MADIADIANDFAEADLQSRINAIRVPPPIVKSTGVCLTCETPLNDARRWCDADCRDQWEARRR